MPQSGFTPLQIYSSSTTGNTPSASNLINSTQGAELAINITDGKLFYKDNSGVVQILASKAGNINVSSLSFGTTGLTPSTATTGAITVAGTLNVANGGTGLTSLTANYIPYGNGTGALSSSSTFIFDGTNLVVGATSAINTGGSRGNITVNGSSSSILSLSTGGTSANSGYVYYDGTNLNLWNNTSSSALIFGASATERMRINSAGNLGLGVVPSAWGLSGGTALQITGGALASYGSSNLDLPQNSYFNGTNWIYTNNGYASMYQQSGGTHYWYVASSGTAGGTATGLATASMTLNNSGYLGIGTSSPAYPLDVAGSGGAAIRSGQGFNLYNSDNTNNMYIYNSGATGSGNGNMLFVSGGVGERMRIASNGYVGIGTNSPDSLLNVAGTLKSSSTSTVGYSGCWIDFSSPNGRIASINSSGSPASNLKLATTTTGGTITTAVTIDYNQNVGIGVAPAGWAGTAQGCLQVGTGGSWTTFASGPEMDFGNNFYYNGNWTYTNTGPAQMMQIGNSSVPYKWLYAGSGTANTTISWSEAMRINSSGFVGIGTSSPSYLLQVAPSGSGSDQLAVFTDNGTWTSNGGIVLADYYAQTTLVGGIKISSSTATSGYLTFHTGGTTERMRIDTSGNIYAGGTTQNGATGVIYARSTCKAFCLVGGGTSPTVSNSFNVASVTYISTGKYQVNFTNAMSSSSYSGVSGLQRGGTSDFINMGFARTASYDEVETWSSGTTVNSINFSVAYFQ